MIEATHSKIHDIIAGNFERGELPFFKGLEVYPTEPIIDFYEATKEYKRQTIAKELKACVRTIGGTSYTASYRDIDGKPKKKSIFFTQNTSIDKIEALIDGSFKEFYNGQLKRYNDMRARLSEQQSQHIADAFGTTDENTTPF